LVLTFEQTKREEGMFMKKFKKTILGFYYDYRKLIAVFCCYGIIGTGLVAGASSIFGDQAQLYRLTSLENPPATSQIEAEAANKNNITAVLENIRSDSVSYSLTENPPALGKETVLSEQADLEESDSKESDARKPDAKGSNKTNKKNSNKNSSKTKKNKSNGEDAITAFASKDSSVYDISNYSKKELAVLERIVEAEAGDQSIKGRVMVANVVLNRIASDEFPNTIKDVVFQNDGTVYQFSPILDGRYYDVDVSKKTKKAVARAFKEKDITDGALYFMSRSGSSNKNAAWFDSSLTKLSSYGCHEFFK